MHRRVGVWGVLAFCLFAASSAGAEEKWTASFEPEVLKTYLDGPDAAVLVAGAGDDVADAVKALADGLRATGAARLVADAAALGAIGQDSDADIVKKAAKQPVNEIIVVRVFPGGTNRPSTAVVTFYSKRSGDAVAAFSVAKGARLQQRRTTAALPSHALDTVRDVVLDSPHLTAEETLAQRGIWMGDSLVDKSVDLSALDTQLKRGNPGIRLGGAELYATLGHPEYANHYRGRVALKMGLATGGVLLALAVGGPLFAVGVALPTSFCQDTASGCGAKVGLLTSGSIVLGGSIIMVVVAIALNPHPISQEELGSLIAEYNEKLRSTTTSSLDAPGAPDIQLVPVLGTDHAGLSLALRF